MRNMLRTGRLTLLLVSLLAGTVALAQTDETDRWHHQLGKRITVTGQATNAKMGARLHGDGFTIWVDLPAKAWPDGMYHGNDKGELVEVTGTVVQRQDVPVIVVVPGEPVLRAGVTVPPGTDVEEASKRYILENVVWNRVVPAATRPSAPAGR